MVINCGGSPSDSAVAMCTASQCTNRFHGKRPPDAREHVVGYGNDVTAPLKPPQRTNCCAFRVKGKAAGNACTNNRPRSFRKRQRRSDLPGLGAQRFQCFRVVFDERSDERTRLDVTNAEGRTLGRRRNRGTLCTRGLFSTFRHDPRQSIPQPCLAEAECPANPPWDCRARAGPESRQPPQARQTGLDGGLWPPLRAGPVRPRRARAR